ncbi:kinase-like domain-containing protein, partial [Gautieria morchelliformis]
RISREIRAWTGLQHPNIARLYGTTREANGSIGLISHFFECGNIVDYIKSADKSKLNILKLLHGTTSGVDYLHGEGIVHGDIKGSNVMVDDEGRAKLIDFGVSRI